MEELFDDPEKIQNEDDEEEIEELIEDRIIDSENPYISEWEYPEFFERVNPKLSAEWY